MIVLTELSNREAAPDFIAYSAAVWQFSFAGDETYTDDLGAEFYWSGRQQVYDIRGVLFGATVYTSVVSVAACEALEESFYWDDSTKTLYVHHADNANDYALGRDRYRILNVAAGYASGTFAGQPSFYPDFYFDPILVEIGALQKRVDPLKFGLLSFESSDYELANGDGRLDAFTLADALNSQVRFVLMSEGQTDIDDGVRIFTGYTGGASRDDARLRVQLREARTFYNRAICPSTFDAATYTDIDERFEGKRIPVAYGTIRRGIAVPIDTAAFDKATGGTVTFKLADDSIDAIRAVTALYDNNGNSVTLGTINLTACTVQTTIAAGADVDLSKFSWQGEGYDIAGDFENGLDIMKAVLVEQGQLAYDPANFDTDEWDAQTAVQTAPVGLSLQSDKGLVEELIEPITVSLQGIVDALGDGRLTFVPRDPAATVHRVIRQDDIIDGPRVVIQTDEVVSAVVVEYAPDFVRNEPLSVIYDDDAESVIAAYGIENTEPVSPVRTVLVDAADALAAGAEVATTSTEPQTIIEVSTRLDDDPIRLLSVVQIDVGRYGVADYRVCEVLARSISLRDSELIVDVVAREIPGRFPVPVPLSFGYDEGEYDESPMSSIDEGLFDEPPAGYLDEGEY